MDQQEFGEIAHSGGQVVLTVVQHPDGRRQYQQTWRHCRPNPSGLIAVYAVPQGLVVGDCPLGGIGSEMPLPPVPGALIVMIGSDSEGRYGHECPACAGYWRSSGAPLMCPYCAFRGESFQFLTAAQRNYVQRYAALMTDALNADVPGEYTIDLDAVADAVGKGCEKPLFYYAEERQQKRFECTACGAFNDVLGTFAYCSGCGTRNDLDEIKSTIASLRAQVGESKKLESIVKEAVGVFDSFCSQYMGQLARIPMTTRRVERLMRMRFHNLHKTADEFLKVFDIDIFAGVPFADIAFAELMFHRRHVYEHAGGQADEKYIRESGDDSVRLGQALRESVESTHRILGTIARFASNIHTGFHEIRPPVSHRVLRHRKPA